MYSLIIYQAITNPYFRIVRVADGGIMTTLTGVVSTTTSWANSVTLLTKDAVRGGIPVTIPEDLPPGDYDLLILDDATPANDDVPLFGKRIAWSGKQILSLLDLPEVYASLP